MTGFSWRSASWGQPTSLWFSVPTKGWSGLSNQLKSTPPLSKVVPKVLGEWPYRHGFFEGDGDDVKDYSCLHWVPSESLQSPVVTGRKHPWSIPHFQISLVFNSSMLFWKAALGRHNFLETKRNVKRPHFEFGLEDTLDPLRGPLPPEAARNATPVWHELSPCTAPAGWMSPCPMQSDFPQDLTNLVLASFPKSPSSDNSVTQMSASLYLSRPH